MASTWRREVPSCPYSPKCLEDEFCELRHDGVLGSSIHLATAKIRHLGDASSTSPLLLCGVDQLEVLQGAEEEHEMLPREEGW